MTTPTEEGEKKKEDTPSEELVGTAAQQRNWRGIAIALLVIVIVCALIVTAVIIATPSSEEQHLGEKFTLNDYLSGKYQPAKFTLQWLPNSYDFMYKSQDNEILFFNCTANTTSKAMDNSTFDEYSPSAYILSPDGRYILLKKKVKGVYRHSSISEYSAYDMRVGDVKKVSMKMKNTDITKFQYMAWGPQGNSLVLVYDNNIYYKPSLKDDAVQFTNTGQPSVIYNGIPDWVYEEEVLQTDVAMWWSPEGSNLLYATFNDSEVPIYRFPIYGGFSNAYTTDMEIAYPKAGAKNPTFKLTVYNLKDARNEASFDPPSELASEDYLFTTVAWRSDTEVLITWMNRVQNSVVFTLCKVGQTTCQKVLEESSDDGWIDMLAAPLFSQDGSKFFVILPKTERDVGIFKHVAMITIMNPGDGTIVKTWLTTGPWEVTNIDGYNDKDEILFFHSPKRDPRQMNLFIVSVTTKDISCLTCEFSKDCLYNKASLSVNATYYVLGCLGPAVPRYSLMLRDGTEINRLQNNTEFYKNISSMALPWIKYEQVDLEDGQKAWCKLLMPPVLKEEEILTYPILLHVYGGPGTQMVKEEYSVDWATALASSRNVIVAMVDGRGSGGRGENFKHANYLKLGTHEVTDTVTAASFFAKQHYVDSNKVAIWGWSYGGYITAMTMGRKNSPFSCGISVAPVTDWIYYDSMYTERFMKTPSENNENYRNANVSKYVDNFKSSSFMLVHGTADDNVHFQQSAQLVKALTEKNVYFRFEMYTDEHHGLEGANNQRYLYTTMEDFLVECFDGVSEIFGNSDLLNRNEDD